jgi:hypothetical protein
VSQLEEKRLDLFQVQDSALQRAAEDDALQKAANDGQTTLRFNVSALIIVNRHPHLARASDEVVVGGVKHGVRVHPGYA